MVFRKKFVAVLLLALFTLNCFSSEKSLPETTGTGQVSGKVVGPDGTALPGVQVTTTYKGKTVQTTTTSTGLFSINIGDVERGQGFNLQFTKTNFENANQAAVISLPNLKVDIGNVTMFISGGSEVTSRKILGQVLDNFSYRPLAGASVTTIDSAGLAVVTTTDDAGKFALTSNYFALQSTFAVSVFKSNFITRTDLVAKITAEDNTIRNNPIRLYHKFGSVYAYTTEDTLGTALNGVTVTLTNSNNQVLQCVTGTGVAPSGPYDNVPLAVGAYCPNLAGITSPVTGTIGDNTGGAKLQNDFLLLGNRYSVSLSRTDANCTARVQNSAVANQCYRPVSTYVDVSLVGDNPISGGSVKMIWDAYIYGTVVVTGPATPISGATVKLYDNTNTYVTQATTSATGTFLLDSTKIYRNQQYKLTIEKTGYYSRLIGYAGPNSNEIILNPINVRGANNANTLSTTGPTISLLPLPAPTHCVTGTVNDYWSGLPVDGATVAIFDGGWRTATTGPAAASLGCPAITNGQFIIGGNFSDPAVDKYDVEISKTGYTGEVLVAKQTFKFTHDGVVAPYNLDTRAACSATGVGPTGGVTCVSKLVLYPVGLFAVIHGSSKYFRNQIKQTYEKFLTEKTGLTISGRTGDLQLTSATPQKTYDYDTLYLHLDDTPKILPGVPEGKWSNHVPVNPLPTVCSPTVSSPCSPQANGVLSENIGTDSRILAWDIKTYVYYHFYAAAPGQYTIQTTGSTDTHITLIAQTGANLGSDDDSGSGSNARIGPINLLRGWYYIKVRGKNDNVFGFFDVSVTGPTQAQTNYNTMLSPAATYATNCAINNGNMVLSFYAAPNRSDGILPGLYIAAPGEDNGDCTASATLERHGPIGDIIRGRFGGHLRPVASAGTSEQVTSTGQFQGFYNIIRSE